MRASPFDLSSFQVKCPPGFGLEINVEPIRIETPEVLL